MTARPTLRAAISRRRALPHALHPSVCLISPPLDATEAELHECRSHLEGSESKAVALAQELTKLRHQTENLAGMFAENDALKQQLGQTEVRGGNRVCSVGVNVCGSAPALCMIPAI